MKATLDYAIIRSLFNELSSEDLPPEISREAAAVIASPEPIPDERSNILHVLEKNGR